MNSTIQLPTKGQTVEGIVVGKLRGRRVEHTIRRTLDRAPWISRNGRSLVITDGGGLDAVELSSVRVIAPSPADRDTTGELPSTPVCPMHGPSCEAWA